YLLGQMHADLTDLANRGTGGVAPVLRQFTAFQPQISEEFALMRARDFARANRIDAAVDFEQVRFGLRRAAVATAKVADRSDHLAWAGTIIAMGLGVIALTALFALLDRAGRRRVRDQELQRLAFEDSLTRLPNRALFEQRIAETLARDERAVIAFLDL